MRGLYLSMLVASSLFLQAAHAQALTGLPSHPYPVFVGGTQPAGSPLPGYSDCSIQALAGNAGGGLGIITDGVPPGGSEPRRVSAVIGRGDRSSAFKLLTTDGEHFSTDGENARYVTGTFPGSLAVSRQPSWYFTSNIMLRPAADPTPGPGGAASLWSVGNATGEVAVPLRMESDNAAMTAPNDSNLWRYFSQLRSTNDGTIFFKGGVRLGPARNTVLEGLFSMASGDPILRSQQSIPGLGVLTQQNPIVSFNIDANGSNLLAIVRATATPSSELQSVVRVVTRPQVSITQLTDQGTTFRTGSLLASSSAGVDERWRRFRHVAINEQARTSDEAFKAVRAIAGQTSASTGSNEVLVVNNTVLARSGSTLNGVIVTGRVTALSVNESGDVAHLWESANGRISMLFINASLVAKVGSPVDWNKNGAIDPDDARAVVSELHGQPGYPRVRLPSESGLFGAGGGLVLTERSSSRYVEAFIVGGVSRDTGPVVAAVLGLKASSPAASCPADYNANGAIDVGDIFSFLSGWYAKRIEADANRDGIVTVTDIFVFLNLWLRGCY